MVLNEEIIVQHYCQYCTKRELNNDRQMVCGLTGQVPDWLPTVQDSEERLLHTEEHPCPHHTEDMKAIEKDYQRALEAREVTPIHENVVEATALSRAEMEAPELVNKHALAQRKDTSFMFFMSGLLVLMAALFFVFHVVEAGFSGNAVPASVGLLVLVFMVIALIMSSKEAPID